MTIAFAARNADTTTRVIVTGLIQVRALADFHFAGQRM